MPDASVGVSSFSFVLSFARPIHLSCKLHSCQDHERAEFLMRRVVISYALVYTSKIAALPSKLLSREYFAYLYGFNIMMPGPS